MFLKAFLVLGCLVLYIASKPLPARKCIRDIEILQDVILKLAFVCAESWKECRNWFVAVQSCPTLRFTCMQLGCYMTINCSRSFIPKINFTRISNLHEKRQYTFCQISKALNDSDCTESKMQELQQRSRLMQGNDTCPSLDNDVRTNMGDFLNNLKQYLDSLKTDCKKNSNKTVRQRAGAEV